MSLSKYCIQGLSHERSAVSHRSLRQPTDVDFVALSINCLITYTCCYIDLENCTLRFIHFLTASKSKTCNSLMLSQRNITDEN